MHKRWSKLILALSVLVTMGALLRAQADKAEPSGAAMVRAAEKFLQSITKEQQAQASFAYDDPERLNWHFIPRPRKGLPLRALDGEPLVAAQNLIASGLSKTGYDQALDVMSLEEVLYLLEPGDRKERREKRDPRKYYLSIFGTPSLTGKWGWRTEGHHISLNYTVDKGEVTSSTPEFFGANPGVIEAGPGRAVRILGAEEDLARQILKLCSPEKSKIAYIDKTAPMDVRSANVPQPDTTAPAGLAAADMNDDQKKLLVELLNEYLKNMPSDVSSRRRADLMQAGLGKIYFAWWGGAERNEPHYYRVQGPTFLIEYNNTQNNANHIHSMWRDMAGDFGIPIKK